LVFPNPSNITSIFTGKFNSSPLYGRSTCHVLLLLFKAGWDSGSTGKQLLTELHLV
jgi:hypothetical protein